MISRIRHVHEARGMQHEAWGMSMRHEHETYVFRMYFFFFRRFVFICTDGRDV